MGNKMTSTPYGLKVKEHTNHADYKDIFEDIVFKIYYNESTHVWTIKSNYDRLWSEGTQYFKGDTILEFTNSLIQEKTVLGQYDQEGTEVYRNIMYRIKCYQGEAGQGQTKQQIQITGGYSPKTYDKETVCTDILHTHTSVYYNGKWHVGMYLLYDNPSIANCWMKKVGSLAITYAKPYWFLMTTQAGIEYGGQVYEARKLIRSWSSNDFVNMSLYYHKTRKRELPNPDTDKFNKLVYDVQCFAPDGQVTLTYEINTVPQDSVTFYPSDSPVRFHNIEFKASSDKWTIYSKCGYIKFDGKTYKTNKAIFSVGFDENLHVEIKDESNIYEIEETTTYTVKSVQVGSISYKLWTTTIDKSLKIEKTVDTTSEPWITVRYYEAMYEPVTIDDLIIEFSNVDMKWYLKSNNDDLYCNGSNYKKGELIDCWDYEYIQNLKYITVLVISAEDGIEIKKISSGDIPYISEDIDEIYDEGIKICYSASKGLWQIISVNDETYYNGLRFSEGQIIVSFKDRTILDQFSILVKKEVEDDVVPFINVMYTCYTGVDLINGITTLTVNGMSWANKSATDANKSTIVTKDTARSMYGYIWQKEETPPVPTWAIFDFIVFRDNYWNTRYVRIKVENNQLVWDHGTLLAWANYAYSYGLGLYNSNYLNECYLSNGYHGYKIIFNELGDPYLTTYDNFYRLPLRTSNYDGYPMIGIINNGTSIALKLTQEDTDPYDWYVDKYISNTTNDILIEQHIRLTDMWGVSVYDDSYNGKTFLINNKLYFINNDNVLMTILVADESTTLLYNYGYENFNWDLNDTINSLYPNGGGAYNFYRTTTDNGSAFEHNGYIYKFIQYRINIIDYDYDKGIWKPGLIKINASNGTWQFLSLSDTQFWSDVPENIWSDDGSLSVHVIESDNQIYLYASIPNQNYSDLYYQGYSLYIYRVDFTNGLEINRLNYFDGTQGHDYVEFKYGSETARCYPRAGNLAYNNTYGCYVFGVAGGGSINRMNYSESNMYCDITVKYSGGLLSNIGKGNYVIGFYSNSTTTMFIAKLHSLDLTPSPENEVFTVGQFS